MKPVTHSPSPRPPPGSQGAAVRSYQDYCAAVLQQHISCSVVVACFGVTVQHNRFIKSGGLLKMSTGPLVC